MIFVTVGMQLPFNRLIKAVDDVSFMLKEISIVAQVAKGGYHGETLVTSEFMSPGDFDCNVAKARLIVSHAGTGTIISALVQNKPIIIMPRLAKFNEHRNDHQLATAKEFEQLNYVHVAYDANELQQKLLALLKSDLLPLRRIGSHASEKLIRSIREEMDLTGNIKNFAMKQNN